MEYWRDFYGGPVTPPVYDGWLDGELPTLHESKTIVDLGCGNGVDTFFLAEQGVDVLACDFSESALDIIRARLPRARVLCFDMTEGLPFADGSVDVVIADLSLHFFPWQQTLFVADEILRVLRPGGRLFCRVNSLDDYHDEEGDELIEPGFYRTSGLTKRFFDESAVRRMLAAFELDSVEAGSTVKYCGKPKHYWQAMAHKKA